MFGRQLRPWEPVAVSDAPAARQAGQHARPAPARRDHQANCRIQR